MGTRNLTIVHFEGTYPVAQYGQWDGYPSGQGATVLDFLKNKMDLEKFKAVLKTCSFLTDDDLKKIDQEIEEQGLQGMWQNKWPEWSRDTGAEILEMVQNGVSKLKNSLSFAADSLFCEWAYVIDLDANVLEVYKGFNESPVKNRFSDLPITDWDGNVKENPEYFHITLAHTFPLDNLPELDEFVKICDPQEEEE